VQQNNHPINPITDLQHQQSLLRMEYEYEKGEFMQKTEKTDIARKIKRGLCWYPVTPGRSYHNSLNKLVIEIKQNNDKETEHFFEPGRTVCFFHQSFNEEVTYINLTATVSYVSGELMVVALPDAGALLKLQSGNLLGVQLYFDETSYRTMFEALNDVISAKNNRLATLRDTLSGTLTAGFRELHPVRFPWLNSAQEKAVNKVLCSRDVAVVHGPPGTGKTTTLVEAFMKHYTVNRKYWSVPKAIQPSIVSVRNS